MNIGGRIEVEKRKRGRRIRNEKGKDRSEEEKSIV